MNTDQKILYFCALEKVSGNNLHVNQIQPLLNNNKNVSALLIHPAIEISRSGIAFPQKIVGWKRTKFVYSPFPSFLFFPWLFIFPFIYLYCFIVIFSHLLFHKYDVIHCRNTMSAAIALPAALLLSKKILCDVRGLYSDEGVVIGRWKHGSITHKFYQKCEFFTYKYSHAITAVSPELAKHVNQLINAQKAVFVPAIVNAEEKYSTSNRQKYRDKFRIPSDHFCLIYVGSIGAWHTEEMLIAQIEGYISANGLQKNKVSVIILTAQNSSLKQLIANHYEHHIVLSVPPGKVHQYLCAADAGLLPGRRCRNKAESNILETMISSKAQEYLAYGLEIVANTSIKFFQTADLKAYHSLSRSDRADKYHSYFSPKAIISQYQRVYNG